MGRALFKEAMLGVLCRKRCGVVLGSDMQRRSWVEGHKTVEGKSSRRGLTVQSLDWHSPVSLAAGKGAHREGGLLRAVAEGRVGAWLHGVWACGRRKTRASYGSQFCREPWH